jgi:hypothetical protein
MALPAPSRCGLLVAAAALTTGAIGPALPSPGNRTLALIAAHRSALERIHEASSEEAAAWATLLRTPPDSPAGAVALAGYVVECRDGGQYVEEDDLALALACIARLAPSA